MTIRAHRVLITAVKRRYVAGGTIAANVRVKFSGADDIVVQCGANEAGIGVSADAAVSGAEFGVWMESEGGIVPVKVGVGGATRGSYSVTTSTGAYTDKAIATGTNAVYLAGQFLESGVVGDLVGLQFAGVGPIVAA